MATVRSRADRVSMQQPSMLADGDELARVRARSQAPAPARSWQPGGNNGATLPGKNGRAIRPPVNIREHLALLDKRLDGLSVGRRLIASLGFDPRAIEFAVYRPGSGYTPERPALPFQLEVEAWNAEDDARGGPSRIIRGRAAVSNVLNAMLPMPSASFAFTLALPPTEAEEVYCRDPVNDAEHAASEAPPAWLAFGPTSPAHPAIRAEVARIFMLPGAGLASDQANVTCTSRVIGHRLTRRNDRYAAPGSGPWTLFRVVEPGDGWVALNLWERWGEVFSAGRDDATTIFGQHLARAIA